MKEGKTIPTVASVIPDSPADDAGILAGWRLEMIDGRKIEDIIDYRLACAEERLCLFFYDALGQARTVNLEKTIDQDPGLVFTSPTLDRVRKCANKCRFCFVDQMPPGLRDSLYVKDDDYRLSFLSGSYLSLSNLSEADLKRIAALRLSPLYVSVQAYDTAVRRSLLGFPDHRDFWHTFDQLLICGIDLHAQIVVCPGYNDGAVLQETVQQLARRRPGVVSVTVVPVGLTRHRESLPKMRLFDKAGAAEIISAVASWSEQAVAAGAGSWIWAADEFYLLAECTNLIPDEEAYEGYPHLENGVGLIRSFMQSWQRLCPLPKASEKREVILITGISGEKALRPVVDALQEHLIIESKGIVNELFGSDVTVTGLLAGADILSQIPPQSVSGKLLLLPNIVLRDGSELFLDGYTLDILVERYRAAGAELRVVPATAQGLYDALFPQKRKPVRRMIL